MICPRCLEDDPQCFYGEVCRRCIVSLTHSAETTVSVQDIHPANLTLTPYQKAISEQLVCSVDNQSVFVDAVCGAGKTEICLELLETSVNQGKTCAWVIPRREVVLEICERLRTYYPHLKITPVCEGHLDDLRGDIIVATSHQMFRFFQSFDVLILDEPDAFPYKGNQTLERYVRLACRGSIVYLSATYEMASVKTLSLPLRPSGVLLPEPEVICRSFTLWVLLCELLKVKEEWCLIFVPTQKIARYLAWVLKCPYVTSRTKDKQQCIQTFRQEGGYLVTTTVLERGVTFLDCFVFVYKACHHVFDESSLVQIAGRARRGMQPRKGYVKFYCNAYTPSIKAACKRIRTSNQDALSVLKKSPK